MIQMDASSFHWIEKEVWHLHVAIDDADGKIVGAYFDYQETLKQSQEITVKDCDEYSGVKKIAGSLLRFIAPLM